MDKIDSSWEARVEADVSDSAESAPLETEVPGQSGEFQHQAESGRPSLEPEVGHAALAGYEDIPAAAPGGSEVHDIWDRRNEPEGTLHLREHDMPGEGQESGEANDEVYDIWDRRNETSGSINLRNFGR